MTVQVGGDTFLVYFVLFLRAGSKKYYMSNDCDLEASKQEESKGKVWRVAQPGQQRPGGVRHRSHNAQ